MSKRTRKEEDNIPSKKRHIEENNENVDVSNLELLQSQQSQPILNSSVLQIDPTLKSGKIKRIHLLNFMCHSNFRVELNKNINVLVGLNGSGKSAILTALAIGLGSKATSTARSTSLKDLVKQGETSATIEITLTNDGYDSFEADVYGKEITVVRHINANTGASTYKIKNESGRVITTGRQDLLKLTMCLNIQVENPVLILNQDAARSFLKECDPKKLYQLFLKATQIEAIIDKLHACLKCAASSKSQLEHLDRSIKQHNSEIVVIKDKHEKLQSVARLRREIVALRNEHEWQRVAKAEFELGKEEDVLVKIQEQLNKIIDFVKNRSKYDKALKNKICEYGTELAALSQGVREKDEAASSCRREFEKMKCDLSATQNVNQNMKERLNTFNQNVQQLETDIVERENNPLNIDNVRKENDEKIRVLEKKKEDISLIINNARRDLDQFQETLNDNVEKIENAKQHQRKVQGQLQACIQQKRQMEGSSKDTLSAYGPSMSQLIKRIEEMHKRGRFAEMPRGPLGRFIEVPDKKFRSAVENILGQSLTSFFVSNDKDRILLSKMLKEFPEFSRLTVITGAFHNQVYDVRNGIVQMDSNDGRLLMDVIKVSDPVVMNCLIDQKHIETIVLVDNTETAIELTQDAHSVPQNLSRVVLLRPFSDYYPAPNYRSYAMKENPVRYIQTSHRDVINGMNEQIKGLEGKLTQIGEAIKKLQAGAKEKEKLVADKKRLVSELMQKDRQYKQDLEELKAIEYPPENEIEYLRTELNNLIKQRKQYMRKINEHEEKCKSEKEACDAKEKIWLQYRELALSAREKMSKLQAEIESSQHQLSEMSADIKLKTNQINDLKAGENECNKQITVLQEKVRALTDLATGDRVESDRSDEVILKLIANNERQIQKVESNKENIEDVKLLLDNKLQQVDKLIKIRTVLDQVLITLEGIRTSRFHYIKRLRQHMSLRCKHKFNVLMALRNYSAEVEIDHKEKTLELKVVPRDSNITDAVSNTKSLSGGERSYSTVSFLISLWSCVDHPFYFLDEYDVFSDEHNRHMMTKLLFNEADKKRDKQYGFLTPQDFSNIQASDLITIHKLQDPERMN